MKDKIVGITLGIKHARSFRISDIGGEMIDDLLYSKDSPFDSRFFPQVQEYRREKVLVNEKTTDYLRINTDDIIVGLSIKSDFDKEYEWLTIKVIEYFKNHLFKKYNLNNISRVGIVFSHKLEKVNSLERIAPILTHDKIKNGMGFNVSFSNKDSVPEAIYRKGVNDYKNYIYSFSELENNLLAELDYQYYFDSPIFDLRECFTEKIFESAEDFLINNYHSWLKNYEK